MKKRFIKINGTQWSALWSGRHDVNTLISEGITDKLTRRRLFVASSIREKSDVKSRSPNHQQFIFEAINFYFNRVILIFESSSNLPMVSATSYQFKLTITLSIKKIYVFHSLQEIHKIENYVIRMCKIWLHEKVIYFMFFFYFLFLQLVFF